jgi:hypothetical protein
MSWEGADGRGAGLLRGFNRHRRIVGPFRVLQAICRVEDFAEPAGAGNNPLSGEELRSQSLKSMVIRKTAVGLPRLSLPNRLMLKGKPGEALKKSSFATGAIGGASKVIV